MQQKHFDNVAKLSAFKSDNQGQKYSKNTFYVLLYKVYVWKHVSFPYVDILIPCLKKIKQMV